MCKLLEWTASEGIWVDKAVQEILDMMNKSIHLSRIFLKKIFDKSTELLKFVLYADSKSQDCLEDECNHIIKICWPFWKIKTAIMM